MKKIVFIILLSLYGIIHAQDSRVTDSLWNELQHASSDTTIIRLLNVLGWELMYSNPDSSISLGLQALKKAEAYPKSQWLAQTYGNLGAYHYFKSDYATALLYYQKALKLYKTLNQHEKQASVYGNMGVIYMYQGDYTKALEYYFKALKIDEELGNKNGIARHLGNIGNVYAEQKEYSKALDYYFKALKITEQLGNKRNIATNLGNIGSIYHEQKDYSKALDYYFKSLDISKKIGDKNGVAINLGNIGVAYKDKGDISKALEYHFKALEVDRVLGNKNGIARHLGNIGNLYIKIGNIKEAVKPLKAAVTIADSIKALPEVKDYSLRLSQLYDSLGRSNLQGSTLNKEDLFRLALEYYKKYVAARDTIESEKNIKQQARLEARYEMDKKETEMRLKHEKEMAVATEKQKRQKMIIYWVSGMLVVLVLLALVIWRALQTTKKQKAIIVEQKNEVEKQKSIVEEKNKEITDSINYAKRIQNAILPPIKNIKECLQKSFILYKPKDIVAGDFYWLECKDDKVLFAVGDCTGHGVPGAMVSVICNNGLNRSVREHNLTIPGEILDKTREIVVSEFEKSEEDVKDGMDISLVSLSYNKNENGEVQSIEVQWAGANNPVWIIRPVKAAAIECASKTLNFKQHTLYEIKGNKQPIGKVENPKPFTTHTVQLQPGDTLYLFTDGFADQFGGPKGKKFKYKPFKELLIAISTKPMSEQQQILHDTFEKWKGNLEQVDDVCIFGVKL